MVVKRSDGGENSLELYRNLPFVLIPGTRHNGDNESLDLKKSAPASFIIDLGKPVGELRTFGTGGLLAPDKIPAAICS